MKIGQQLMCINAQGQTVLVEGCIYTYTYSEAEFIWVKELPPRCAGGWYKWRFVPLKPLDEPAETYETDKVTA